MRHTKMDIGNRMETRERRTKAGANNGIFQAILCPAGLSRKARRLVFGRFKEFTYCHVYYELPEGSEAILWSGGPGHRGPSA